MQEKVQVPVDQCKSLVVDRNRQYTYLVVVVVQSARDSIPRGWKPKTGEYYGLGFLRVLCARAPDQHGVVCTGKK